MSRSHSLVHVTRVLCSRHTNGSNDANSPSLMSGAGNPRVGSSRRVPRPCSSDRSSCPSLQPWRSSRRFLEPARLHAGQRTLFWVYWWGHFLTEGWGQPWGEHTGIWVTRFSRGALSGAKSRQAGCRVLKAVAGALASRGPGPTAWNLADERAGKWRPEALWQVLPSTWRVREYWEVMANFRLSTKSQEAGEKRDGRENPGASKSRKTTDWVRRKMTRGDYFSTRNCMCVCKRVNVRFSKCVWACVCINISQLFTPH